MILIGLGGNLPNETFGPARTTCGVALSIMESRGHRVPRRSRWYESAPVPVSDQPRFVNAVVAVETALDPEALVAELLEIEAELGRRRSVPNAARTVDLDVIAYDERIVSGPPPGNVRIPHPRLAERAFVLLPLKDVVPDWRHPATGEGIDALISRLPAGQDCRPVADGPGRFGTEWTGRALE